jgi:hypothetical protein
MPKVTRKQKSRSKDQTMHAVRTLTARYQQVVEDFFIFSEWIITMLPECKESMFDPIVKWFIAQTLLYINVFAKDVDGKRCVMIDKEEFVKVMKDNKILESLNYSDTFTKEMVREFMGKCVQKFFENTMFPIVDFKQGDTGKSIEEDLK